MLSGNTSISHYTAGNMALWMSLAFQAGVINVGAFMGCHRFISHITGFASHFGIEMADGNFLQAFGMLAVPVFFLAGAMLSGQLVDIRLKAHKKPLYFVVFGLIFFLIISVWIGGSLGVFGLFGAAFDRVGDYLLIALLCLASGLQNATVTTVSKSVIRTTHLTGITTDLGIGLVRVFNRRQGNDTSDGEATANWMRIGLIMYFAFGSVIGAVLFRHFGYHGFLLAVATSGTLFAITLYYQVLQRFKKDRSL